MNLTVRRKDDEEPKRRRPLTGGRLFVVLALAFSMLVPLAGAMGGNEAAAHAQEDPSLGYDTGFGDDIHPANDGFNLIPAWRWGSATNNFLAADKDASFWKPWERIDVGGDAMLAAASFLFGLANIVWSMILFAIRLCTGIDLLDALAGVINAGFAALGGAILNVDPETGTVGLEPSLGLFLVTFGTMFALVRAAMKGKSLTAALGPFMAFGILMTMTVAAAQSPVEDPGPVIAPGEGSPRAIERAHGNALSWQLSPAGIAIKVNSIVNEIGVASLDAFDAGSGGCEAVNDDDAVGGSDCSSVEALAEGSSAPPKCGAFQATLREQYLEERGAQRAGSPDQEGVFNLKTALPERASRLWERSHLSMWMLAQFGSTDSLPRRSACIFLENSGGVPLAATREAWLETLGGTLSPHNGHAGAQALFDSLKTWDRGEVENGERADTPAAGPDDDGEVGGPARVFGGWNDLTEGKRFMVFMAACRKEASATMSDSGWATMGQFTWVREYNGGNGGSHGDNAMQKECNDIWDGYSEPGDGRGVFFFTDSGDINKHTTANNRDSAEARTFLKGVYGFSAGNATIYGFGAIVTALLYLWVLGPMALGVALAQVGLAIMLCLLPLVLLVMMWPGDRGKQAINKVMKLLLTFMASKLVLMFFMSLLIVIISVIVRAGEAMPGLDGLSQTLWMAFSPVIALFVLRALLMQIGMQSITTLKGAAAFTNNLGKQAMSGKMLSNGGIISRNVKRQMRQAEYRTGRKVRNAAGRALKAPFKAVGIGDGKRNVPGQANSGAAGPNKNVKSAKSALGGAGSTSGGEKVPTMPFKQKVNPDGSKRGFLERVVGSGGGTAKAAAKVGLLGAGVAAAGATGVATVPAAAVLAAMGVGGAVKGAGFVGRAGLDNVWGAKEAVLNRIEDFRHKAATGTPSERETARLAEREARKTLKDASARDKSARPDKQVNTGGSTDGAASAGAAGGTASNAWGKDRTASAAPSGAAGGGVSGTANPLGGPGGGGAVPHSVPNGQPVSASPIGAGGAAAPVHERVVAAARTATPFSAEQTPARLEGEKQDDYEARVLNHVKAHNQPPTGMTRLDYEAKAAVGTYEASGRKDQDMNAAFRHVAESMPRAEGEADDAYRARVAQAAAPVAANMRDKWVTDRVQVAPGEADAVFVPRAHFAETASGPVAVQSGWVAPAPLPQHTADHFQHLAAGQRVGQTEAEYVAEVQQAVGRVRNDPRYFGGELPADGNPASIVQTPEQQAFNHLIDTHIPEGKHTAAEQAELQAKYVLRHADAMTLPSQAEAERQHEAYASWQAALTSTPPEPTAPADAGQTQWDNFDAPQAVPSAPRHVPGQQEIPFDVAPQAPRQFDPPAPPPQDADTYTATPASARQSDPVHAERPVSAAQDPSAAVEAQRLAMEQAAVQQAEQQARRDAEQQAQRQAMEYAARRQAEDARAAQEERTRIEMAERASEAQQAQRQAAEEAARQAADAARAAHEQQLRDIQEQRNRAAAELEEAQFMLHRHNETRDVYDDYDIDGDPEATHLRFRLDDAQEAYQQAYRAESELRSEAPHTPAPERIAAQPTAAPQEAPAPAPSPAGGSEQLFGSPQTAPPPPPGQYSQEPKPTLIDSLLQRARQNSGADQSPAELAKGKPAGPAKQQKAQSPKDADKGGRK